MNQPAEKSRKRKKLPSLGVKLNKSSNPEEEQREVQCFLQQQVELLKEQKIEKSHLLICAEWDDSTFEAKVTKNSGSSLEVFGHSRNQQVYFHPEEALFLIEMNKLQLFYNDIRLSVQRSYSVLLQPACGVSLHHYRVYKHFVIQGYKLFRREDSLPNRESDEGDGADEACESTYGIFFQKLRIFDSLTENDFKETNKPQVSYDVFVPGLSIKKSCRPEPNYHLIILSSSEEKLWDLLHLAKRTGKSNLLFASAEGSGVSVFNLQNVEIPNLH